MKKVALLALLTALAVIVGLLALEGLSSITLLADGARSARPAPDNFRQAVYDSILGWVGIPNLNSRNNYGPGLTLTTNADGMRIHRPTQPALGPGEHRIICSGDSFTFGSGVSDDETFCADLESDLPGVRTLNMAQRGFGIDQAYLWYKRDAAKYPHQVQLFAFIWHDFERMALKTFTGYPKPILHLTNDAIVVGNVPVPAWNANSDRSAFWAIVSGSRLMQLMQRKASVSDAEQMHRVDEQVWSTAEAVFTDLGRLNKARGSTLVLVYLPAPPDLWPNPSFDSRRTRLAQFSQRTGIPFVDLTAEMRTIPADSLDWMFITPNALPVNGSSGHYTASGHRWIAARLAEHLRGIPGGVPAATAKP